MIDTDGYRPNVGIILCNQKGQVFWARRIGQDAWQFPQGGIRVDESPEDALYRELEEEVGLRPDDVEIIGSTRGWLRYRLPKRLVRRDQKPLCVGQKQVWFMLKLLAEESKVRFDMSDRPEFDSWQWVDYWKPLSEVVFFKRNVYRLALKELMPFMYPAGIEPSPRRAGARSSKPSSNYQD